jgi:hypothetical protein
MSQNSQDSITNHMSISLSEIIQSIFKSKLILIFVTLSCTIAAFFYSGLKDEIYHSNGVIEIGEYGSNKSTASLIEPPKELVQDLKIQFIHKSSNNISNQLIIQLLEDKLIKVEYSSNSIEENNIFFSNLMDYLNNKHVSIINDRNETTRKATNDQLIKLDRLLEFEKNLINDSVILLKKQIAAYDEAIRINSNNPQLLISYNLEKNQLLGELSKSQYDNDLFAINESKISESSKLKELEKPFYKETQLIGNVFTSMEKQNRATLTFLGFLIGLFVSLSIIIIRLFDSKFNH